MELGERKNLILSSIVEQYIETGEPIGSKLLMQILPISVSSATIRNEMSDLSELGFLIQPHTSAGRIPSQLGYRYYVDNLMNKKVIEQDEQSLIENEFSLTIGDPEKILQKANELLARITNCASLATTPTDDQAIVKHIEIVLVGSKIAMIVLMTSSGIIKNGVCKTETPITPEMVEDFYAISNECFVGKPVSDIGTVMIQTLVASLGSNALAMSPLFVILADIANQAIQAEVKLEGQQNLLNHREFQSQLFDMMKFLNESEKVERAISCNKNPLSIMIGKENMYKQLENTSLIVARYHVQGGEGGSIGIIGPTRIDYANLIPRIEYLTDLVGRLLTDTLDKE